MVEIPGIKLMTNFEAFFNGAAPSDWDPLVKMAVLHHQFESIHPFYDGNGRTGRILNLLYLVKEGLLDTPVLYLSRYINHHKAEYYRLLQKVHEENAWEPWVLFMLEAVEQTSLHTSKIISGIKALMLHHKQRIRSELPKIYSQDLLNVLFRHPYTKIEFVVKELGIGRVTAGRYLDELVSAGILNKRKLWRDNYYINVQLYDLLANVNSL